MFSAITTTMKIDLLVFTTIFFYCCLHQAAADSLLVGNTRGNGEILQYFLKNDTISTFYSDGLVAPDHIVWYDGAYYISTGTDLDTSAVAKIEDGAMNLTFASGGGLMRPYGFDFYNDTLYVASFMTDQVLMFDAMTGEYIGVFAQGDMTEDGLCNGPNQIKIYDKKLYLTTQGSFVDESGNLNYAFASQVVVYDLETGEGSVFIPPPEPDAMGLGFISMLGIEIGCGEDSVLTDDCTVYTTDFAGGLRLYKLSDQSLIDSQSTSFAMGASSGGLALGKNKTVYVPGFTSEENGAIMSFNVDADPGNNGTLSVVYGPEGELKRPIGILFLAEDEDGSNGDGDTSAAPGFLLQSIVAGLSLMLAPIL